MFSQVLHTVDLFGLQVRLNYSGKEKSYSKVGGLCSILFFGFVVWVLINGSRDLFTRVNPKTITSQSFRDNPVGVTISPQTFPIALQIESSGNTGYTTFIDESIYTVNARFLEITRTTQPDGSLEEETIEKKINLERCTPAHFGDFGKTYELIFTSPIYCIAFNQTEVNQSLDLVGTWDTSYAQMIQIDIVMCNNDTSPIPCATQETINEYLTGGYLDLLYNSVVIDPNNFEYPNTQFQDYYYTMISPVNYHETAVEIGHTDVLTDSGWITEASQQRNFCTVAKVIDNVIPTPDPDRSLASIKYLVSKQSTLNYRRYKKVQDVLAETGGLANMALIVLLIMTSNYLKLKMREGIVNKLFTVDLSSDGPDSPQKKSKKPGRDSDIYQDLEASSSTSRISLRKIDSRRFQKEASMSFEDRDSKGKTTSFPTTSLHTFVTKKSLVNKQKNKEQSQTKTRISRKDLESPKKDLLCHTSPSLHYNKDYQSSNSLEILFPKIKVVKVAEQQEKGDITQRRVISEYNDRHFENLDFEAQSFVSTFRPMARAEYLEAPRMDIKDIEKDDGDLKNLDLQKVEKSVKDKFLANKSNSNSLSLTIWEYIRSFGCRSKSLKEKMTVLRQGVKEVDRRLDINYILNKFIEMDKLIALMLDREQCILFENLPKPKLMNKGLVTELGRRIEPPSPLQNVALKEKQLLEAYKVIRNKDRKTAIDMRLLEIFNENSE